MSRYALFFGTIMTCSKRGVGMMALMARSSLASSSPGRGHRGDHGRIARRPRSKKHGQIVREGSPQHYCRIGWLTTRTKLVLVVEHGSPITTTDVVEKDQKRVISFRAASTAVLLHVDLGSVEDRRRGESAPRRD